MVESNDILRIVPRESAASSERRVTVVFRGLSPFQDTMLPEGDELFVHGYVDITLAALMLASGAGGPAPAISVDDSVLQQAA